MVFTDEMIKRMEEMESYGYYSALNSPSDQEPIRIDSFEKHECPSYRNGWNLGVKAWKEKYKK